MHKGSQVNVWEDGHWEHHKQMDSGRFGFSQASSQKGFELKTTAYIQIPSFQRFFLKMVKIRPSINFYAKFWLINRPGKKFSL